MFHFAVGCREPLLAVSRQPLTANCQVLAASPQPLVSNRWVTANRRQLMANR